VLVIFLFIAAGAYFGFATVGREVVGASAVWTLVELLQVVVFGTMALLGLRGSPFWLALGLRGSPFWLAAGWALHPFWDFLLHYTGPGEGFTPWTYAIACISFDWLLPFTSWSYMHLDWSAIGDGPSPGPCASRGALQGRPAPSEDVERVL
jgi:hypothetical protein